MSIMETSLVVQQSGIAQFEGSVQEMAQKLEDMKAKIALVNQFFKDVMEKDVDFGIIPGTQKPSLYQPGADKLCSLYNLSKIIVSKDENKNFETGHYDSTVKVRLVHRGSGVVAGELEGSCSTMESKYRYRWVGEREVPKGIDKDTLFFKEYEGKYGPYKKYRIENDDLYSQWNTVLKMAIKRAYVGCTLSSTGLSGLFSQEEKDLDDWIEGGEELGQGQGGEQGKTGNGRRRPNTQNGRGTTGGATRANSGGNQKPASENQIKAIFGSTKGKGLTADEAKALVLAKTGKSIDELTLTEASGMIDLINKSTADDLYVIIDAANNPGNDNPPDLNEGGYQ